MRVTLGLVLALLIACYVASAAGSKDEISGFGDWTLGDLLCPDSENLSIPEADTDFPPLYKCHMNELLPLTFGGVRANFQVTLGLIPSECGLEIHQIILESSSFEKLPEHDRKSFLAGLHAWFASNYNFQAFKKVEDTFGLYPDNSGLLAFDRNQNSIYAGLSVEGVSIRFISSAMKDALANSSNPTS